MIKKIFIPLLISLFFPVIAYCAEYIDFTLTTYDNSNYDITYYRKYKEIAKQYYKGNKLVKMTGSLPDGKLKLLNFNNLPVAIVNIKNNKFEGQCIFLQRKYSVRFNPPYEKVKSMYKAGILNGPTEIFNINGDIAFKLNYKDGALDGESFFFDYAANEKKVMLFKNGKKVSEHVSKIK